MSLGAWTQAPALLSAGGSVCWFGMWPEVIPAVRSRRDTPAMAPADRLDRLDSAI